MSSYADIASKGPAQPEEEKVPHALPEIVHDDSATIHDPLHEHHDVSTVSYADQQLQAERAAAAQRESDKKANEISKESRDFMEASTASEAKLTGSSSGAKKDFEQAANNVEKNAKQTAGTVEKDLKQAAEKADKKYQDVKGKAVDEYENNIKPAVKKGVEEGKKEGKKAEQWAEKNKDNPVVVGNAVVFALLGAGLSFGAYRMHSQNRLTGQVVAATAGVLSLFAISDYYVSQFFFQKYPPKN